MSDREQLETRALHVSSCVLCGHTLIDHHTASLRCQHRSNPRWWSRRVQCPCDMIRRPR
mgnify:CR=1 FL=1